MTYEAWRMTYQDAEQAARAAWQMAQQAEFESSILKMFRARINNGDMIELSKRGEKYLCEIFVPINSGAMRGYEGEGLTMIGAFEAAMNAEEAGR